MRIGAVAAISLVIAISTPVMAASVKDGVDAWQHGDFASAVAIWQPLAGAGDADAAFDLGQAYKLGRGVPLDLVKARELYGRAAKAGHPQGAADYGLLLFHEGQRATAMPWIVQASAAGDPRAQYVYATALYNGDYVPRDWPMAYALMARAASAGLPQATTNLALIDQSITPAQRRKGIEIAAGLAGQPLPPINRRLISGLPRQRRDAVAAADPAPVRASFPIPSKPHPAPPTLATSAGGRWQVQLGAYGSLELARDAWKTIRGKAPSLRALPPRYEKAGQFTRLRLGPLADRAAAGRACVAVRSAGGACFLIAQAETQRARE